MLNILWMIILIIILFIIILLAVGVKITFHYNKTGSEFKGCLKILILKKIKVYSQKFPSDDEDEEEDEDKERKRVDIKKIFNLAKPCFKDLMNYLKVVLSKIHIVKARNHLIFGLDSYADTGKYIGIIWAVLSIVDQMNEKLELSAEPSFNGSRIDMYGENEVEISILKIIGPTVRLLVKKDVRRLIKGVLDER